MFKLLRYYSVASLVSILATATLLIWFYRQVSYQGIVQLAEQSNLTLAQSAMNALNPALLDFLNATADLHPNPNGAGHTLLPPELAGSIKSMMQNRSIVRIKIFNRQGVVAFSTSPAQIGSVQSHNQGFITAINGEVDSFLVYHDTFNSFDAATEEDNLIQTYIPVRASPTEPILGVFELYTDVSPLVLQTERHEFIIMVGTILSLSALYTVLFILVRRANHTIELQQRTIRERTQTLEVLSAQMLESEESHKKKIAFELHEGLAQTLVALKLKVENDRRHHKENDAAAESPESIIPLLQEAIREVRTIAIDLRPPSLDDLGLLPTLNGFCREFEQQHPPIRIERHISLQERDIPTPLKIILYRIIVSVFDDMAQHMNTGRIHLALWQDEDTLVLLLDDTATEALDRTVTPLMNINPKLRAGFARMEELTTLSGGVFSASYFSGGGTTLRAAWSH
jgi:signal transduction histidine kinase